MLAFMNCSGVGRRQAPEDIWDTLPKAMTLISKERAILFADVSGSTALYELLGDKPAAKAIDALLGVLREVISARDGQVVKTIGDELMVVFNSPAAACEAAREMQQRVSTWPPTSGAKLAIRIGFHFGIVLEDKGDFWGDGVNTAARLAGLAKAGQILTTGATANALPGLQRSNLRDLDAITVKGKQDAVRVFELMWGDTDDATHVASMAASARVEARLTLELGERTIVFPRDKRGLILGRENPCNIVTREKPGSGGHAGIER